MKPVLKWVGNKTPILDEIEKITPNSKKYFEPFVGGGSVFFHLSEKRAYTYTCISDINSKLITTYNIIKDRPNDLISELKKIKENYDRKNYRTQKGIFQRKRDFFNKTNSELDIASHFIFLNKTCFSGLYRTNINGNFNGSFARVLTVDFDYENILKASKMLKNTKICCFDYKNILKYIDDESFVFLDPPYYKTFNNYYNKGFDGKNLVELVDFCYKIDDLGGKFVLCNKKSQKIKDVFDGFSMKEVELNKSIKGKQKRKEFLIYNGGK